MIHSVVPSSSCVGRVVGVQRLVSCQGAPGGVGCPWCDFSARLYYLHAAVVVWKLPDMCRAACISAKKAAQAAKLAWHGGIGCMLPCEGWVVRVSVHHASCSRYAKTGLSLSLSLSKHGRTPLEQYRYQCNGNGNGNGNNANRGW